MNTTPAKPIARHHDTGRSTPVTIQGVTYPSISNAALSNGLSPATLQFRIKNGVADGELLKPGRAKRKVVERDNYYDRSVNLRALARKHGVKYATVMQRIRSGVPEDQLFAETIRRTGKEVIIDDVVYPSRSEAARALNISVATLRRRLEEGLTGKDLSQAGKRGRRGISITVCGKDYENLAHVAREFGLSRALVSLRYKNGKRDEELVAAPGGAGNRGRSLQILGQDYASMSEAARALNIDYTDLRSLVKLAGPERLDAAVRTLVGGETEVTAA